MAKQLGIIQYSGKLGNTVGRRKSIGQKANTLAARATSVANPQTLAQQMQRVKVAPVLNFYRALPYILDHSFQGVQYGSPSFNYFRKHAMLQTEDFPYLEKGDTRPVPGAYLVSNGSLPTLTVDEMIQTSNHVAISVPQILNITGEEGTIGEVSESILNQSSLVQEGDQLTFIVCCASDDDYSDPSVSFIYKTARFVIDSQSSVSVADWSLSQGGATFLADEFRMPADLGIICGGCVILSRPPYRNGGAWQRSRTLFKPASTIYNWFMRGDRQTAAIESYTKKVADNVTSDWYLNQGNNNGAGAVGGGTQRALTTVSVNIGGQNRNVLAMTQGNNTYIVASDITAGKRSLYTYDGSNNATAINPTFNVADVEALGYQVRLITTVQSYFPNLQVNEGAINDNP